MKKTTVLILIVIFLGLPAAPAQSENIFSRSNEKSKLEFGTEVFYFNYKEPGIMEEDGAFYGIFGAYTFRDKLDERIYGDGAEGSNKTGMFKIEGRLDFGEVDYTSQNTGSIDNIEDWIFEVRGLAGCDFYFGDAQSGRVTPYLGFAYRYLNDDSAGRVSTTGHFGYERESNYYYVPVGIEIHREFAADWGATLNLEYDWFIQGKQRSHLGDAVTGLNTVENDQEKGYGLRASARITKYNPSVDFFVEPFIRYWDIDDSNVSAITFSGLIVGSGVEPANESYEAGLRLGLHY